MMAQFNNNGRGGGRECVGDGNDDGTVHPGSDRDRYGGGNYVSITRVQLRQNLIRMQVSPCLRKLASGVREILHISKLHRPPWRNWLARSAVNRKVGGSSPPGGDPQF